MKVQIYALTNVQDAIDTVEAGADLIGVVADNDRRVVEDCTSEHAREIFAAVEHKATCVALSLGVDADRIGRMLEITRAPVLHLAARDLPPADIARIRKRVGNVKLMLAVLVDGPGAIAVARERARLADYIILDSGSSAVPITGATGQTHDWNISAHIVAECPVPVILAGGLSPENVAEAVRVVRPWAVDSFTRTDKPGQRGIKDPERVRAFIRNARAAWTALQAEGHGAG
ncbi:MAG: phosphoribosylanthranilate isomerase [Gammaproteobacteria bacterium]|nr:phosphoribosylanthranilate isomerase [Gammaproteobacteria bacterium]